MKRSATMDIVDYMRVNKKEGITNDSAHEMFGVTRLSSIIHDLRRRGYDIETRIEVCKTRYGRKQEYARYILHEEA